jgi:hypothetical protein
LRLVVSYKRRHWQLPIFPISHPMRKKVTKLLLRLTRLFRYEMKLGTFSNMYNFSPVWEFVNIRGSCFEKLRIFVKDTALLVTFVIIVIRRAWIFWLWVSESRTSSIHGIGIVLEVYIYSIWGCKITIFWWVRICCHNIDDRALS